jgi:hypothetical protein
MGGREKKLALACRLGQVLLACLFIQPLCSLYTAAYSHAYGNDNTYGMTAALLIS